MITTLIAGVNNYYPSFTQGVYSSGVVTKTSSSIRVWHNSWVGRISRSCINMYKHYSR